mmetsp:Transcript_36088/g.103873  ORF Transcript_36088/g.103873 Transcript_36088/m.103873 type:complete len:813 (-) Transcript_36088:193-2631(-)
MGCCNAKSAANVKAPGSREQRPKQGSAANISAPAETLVTAEPDDAAKGGDIAEERADGQSDGVATAGKHSKVGTQRVHSSALSTEPAADNASKVSASSRDTVAAAHSGALVATAEKTIHKERKQVADFDEADPAAARSKRAVTRARSEASTAHVEESLGTRQLLDSQATYSEGPLPGKDLAGLVRGFTADASHLLAAMDADSDGQVSSQELKRAEESGIFSVARVDEDRDPRLGGLVRSFTMEAERLLGALDGDADGKVSPQELRDGTRRDIIEVSGDRAPVGAGDADVAPPAGLSRLVRGFTAEAGQLLEAFDNNRDGALNAEEFKHGVATGAIEADFISMHSSGAVKEEQRSGLKSLVRGFTAEAARLMEALDADRDGRVAVNELRAGEEAGLLELNVPKERLARTLRGFTKEAEQVLQALDQNVDGSVSPAELKQGANAGVVEVSEPRDAHLSDPSMRTLVRGLTAEAHRLLRALDANGDGGVAVGKFRDGARSEIFEVSDVAQESPGALGTRGQRLTGVVRGMTAEATRLLKALDVDADGSVSRTELKRGEKDGIVEVAGARGPSDGPSLRAMVHGFTLEARRLLEALDANGDGALGSEEFKGAARAGIVEVPSSGPKPGCSSSVDATAERLLASLDINGDGVVSREELDRGFEGGFVSLSGEESRTTCGERSGPIEQGLRAGAPKADGEVDAECLSQETPKPKKVQRKTKTTVINRKWTESDDKALQDSVAKVFEIFDNRKKGLLAIDDLTLAVKAGVLRPGKSMPPNEPASDVAPRPRAAKKKTPRTKDGKPTKVRIQGAPEDAQP